MNPFTVHTGTAVPLRRSNVDTDQIIPAEYLKRITRTGFEDALFASWRSDPTFVLNQPQWKDATILVAGPDFGTGSSREHAVWALQDYGFRVIISSRFADIFRGNSFKGGLLTVILDESDIEALWSEIESDPTTQVTVDLETLTVKTPMMARVFDLDPHTRHRLLNGLDDIGLTLGHDAEISDFESARPSFMPRTLV